MMYSQKNIKITKLVVVDFAFKEQFWLDWFQVCAAMWMRSVHFWNIMQPIVAIP